MTQTMKYGTRELRGRRIMLTDYLFIQVVKQRSRSRELSAADFLQLDSFLRDVGKPVMNRHARTSTNWR